MTFRIDHERTFTRTIEPVGGGSFDAEFRVLPDEQFEEVTGAGADNEKAALRKMLKSVGGVVGGDEELPSSPEVIEQLIGYLDIRLALFAAYTRGVREARAGN